MRYRLHVAGVLGSLLLASCGSNDVSEWVPDVPALTGPSTPAVDAGTALAEARRCGRAIAVAARCNFLRDDRDVAALRFTVLQGLDQRYGAVVDEPRLTEAVDLAVLDRMATIGQCTIPSRDMPAVQSGLRDVLGTCAAP